MITEMSGEVYQDRQGREESSVTWPVGDRVDQEVTDQEVTDQEVTDQEVTDQEVTDQEVTDQ